MQKRKEFACLSILILCVTVVLLGFSNPASAITGITSDLVPDTYINGVPCLVLNKGEYYSFDLTPQSPIGQISWYGEWTDYDSPQEVQPFGNNGLTNNGGIIYAEGTLYSDTYYACILRAYDSGATGENASREYSYIIQNANYTGSIETPHFVLSPDVPTELPIGIISPVPGLSPDVIARLAQNISVDPSELILLTSADFTTSDPPEPTQSMRQEVASQNGQFLAKLNTITVSKDGWYVFKVTVSDDLVGTPVSDLRLFCADGSDFTGSFTASFGSLPLFNGVTGMYEVSSLFGWEIDTLPKQFLVTMLLSAGTSLTTYFVKILLMLLAGGCSAGLGIGAVCATVAVIAAVKSRRKKASRSKQE